MSRSDLETAELFIAYLATMGDVYDSKKVKIRIEAEGVEMNSPLFDLDKLVLDLDELFSRSVAYEVLMRCVDQIKQSERPA